MHPQAWLDDPTGAHELRYWDGAAWTEHVSDQGVQALDAPPAYLPPPEAVVAAPPPPPPVAAPAEPSAGRGSWKDKLKQAAQSAAVQGKALADQTRTVIGEQQSRRVEQWNNDPETLWHGQSQSAATKATGMSKAAYRITKDRIWIDSGLLGTKSESVPLWAVRDLDVRQSVLQRGSDIGDVVLSLEDPAYSVDPIGASNFSGMAEPGATTSGQVLLDNISGPYGVRELLMPLISEARSRKLRERQSQYLQVSPAAGAMGFGAASAPPAPPPPAVDLPDQLRQLAELRDQGILTEDEFAQQKARLLGG